jgi:hypothetical protein
MGAVTSQLRRTSSMRPVTPTMLDVWDATPPRRASCTSMSTSSSGGSASLPSSLQQHEGEEGVNALHAAPGGPEDVESLRAALAAMQARLSESEIAASALAQELGCRDQGYSDHLAQVQNSHAEEMHALESTLRAEARALKPAREPPRSRARSAQLGMRAATAVGRAATRRHGAPRHAPGARTAPTHPHARARPRLAARRGARLARARPSCVRASVFSVRPRAVRAHHRFPWVLLFLPCLNACLLPSAPRPPSSAQAQDALDAAANELEAAATERSRLWGMLREGKPAPAPVVVRRRSVGRAGSCGTQAWSEA